jgi:hypothetical protein
LSVCGRWECRCGKNQNECGKNDFAEPIHTNLLGPGPDRHDTREGRVDGWITETEFSFGAGLGAEQLRDKSKRRRVPGILDRGAGVVRG